MQTITLTPAQLTDLVEDAFNLGKRYTIDELNDCGLNVIIPRNDTVRTSRGWVNKYEAFVECSGGLNLYSGDAKTDLILRHANESLREVFRCD